MTRRAAQVAGWRSRVTRAVRLAIALATAAAACATSPRAARAAAFDVSDTGWEGCSELLEVIRSELGSARVEPVGVLDWSRVAPEDGVLVIHPADPLDPDESHAFMSAGGRLAILDDYGRGDETLRRYKIERVPPPSRPALGLRSKAALAIAEPALDVGPGRSASGPHPVVARVQRLVTNHPTGLRQPELTPVLRIRAIGEPDVPVALAGQVGRGRLFAMSDPSAFINQMLRYPGNRAFVAGLARYLVDDDAGQRRQGRVFVVVNRFDERGAFGGRTTLRKDFESQLRSLADAAETARREGFPKWLLVALAAAAILGVGGWVARRAARPYRSPRPRYARPTPLVGQGGLAGRFALLAAPSSPRALALLELKSALFEAVAHRFALPDEPGADVVVKLLAGPGLAAAGAPSAGELRDVLAAIQRVEAAMVAGAPPHVPRSALARASSVVGRALAACGAHGPSFDAGALARAVPFVPPARSS